MVTALLLTAARTGEVGEHRKNDIQSHKGSGCTVYDYIHASPGSAHSAQNVAFYFRGPCSPSGPAAP